MFSRKLRLIQTSEEGLFEISLISKEKKEFVSGLASVNFCILPLFHSVKLCNKTHFISILAFTSN